MDDSGYAQTEDQEYGLPVEADLLHRMAVHEHKHWADYMLSFFGNCSLQEDGSYLVSAAYARALDRLIHTHYDDLPDHGQELDMIEARRWLQIFKRYLLQVGITQHAPYRYGQEGGSRGGIS